MKKLCLLLCIAASLHAKQPCTNLITGIRIKDTTITYHVNKNLHDTYLRENLYVTYPDDIALGDLDYTIITMPLILNTIGIVWISGQDYEIPAIDKDLYESLAIVKEIFKRMYPATAFNGNLIAKTIVDNNKRWNHAQTNPGIALPFSHGLDSLCTSLRLRATPQLLITARGMPDTPLENADYNWQETQYMVNHFADLHGHTTAFITSNFHEFFNWATLGSISPEITHWRICMVESLGWMGLAAPILIQKGYNQFILPANDDWDSLHPGAGCPLVDETIVFAGIKNTCDGFELPRLEKNRVIRDICNENQLEKPFSMICETVLNYRENCNECQKCVASILSLLLLHENPQEYGFNVDVPTFITYMQNEFFKENTFGHHSFRTFAYCQKLAHEVLASLSPELQDFFAWYCSVDLTKYENENPRIALNYNDFVDLYAYIPEDVLKRHRTLFGDNES